jgi:adenosylcobinamide kinase/adenosylcobinamide-phosphate guanylyltransferase
MEILRQTDRKLQARLIYISGGCRSGKSAYAQRLAEECGAEKLYLATCPPIDAEMDQRIAAHQRARAGRGWQTMEEPLDLAAVLRRVEPFDVLLIDCLTLWVNNLLYRADQEGRDLSEEVVADECRKVLTACRAAGGTIIVVSNELGMGLVPGDALSRRYRDLIGRCNQHFATAADEAILMVSGLPLKLK